MVALTQKGRRQTFERHELIVGTGYGVLLSSSCSAAKLLVHPQDLIRQVAALRSMLQLNMASCRIWLLGSDSIRNYLSCPNRLAQNASSNVAKD